ncbi:hypothetical protein STEG23_008956, partial [Scotinomys teguina]
RNEACATIERLLQVEISNAYLLRYLVFIGVFHAVDWMVLGSKFTYESPNPQRDNLRFELGLFHKAEKICIITSDCYQEDRDISRGWIKVGLSAVTVLFSNSGVLWDLSVCCEYVLL